ncbi:pentapeptide repeat-containing protein [Streptomyces lydicus]|uniref:pentapeptide repeat-containing protein n=1 Tax=Streptomyces lydicus TaxID=47763 RepID=UPI003823CE51
MSPLPPPWLHCGHGAHPATDPVGCHGSRVPGHTMCLAHLADTDRNAYLSSLAPGIRIDHRGTPFSERLFAALLNALRDPTTGIAHLQGARFEEARFSGTAFFYRVQFSGDVDFEGAQFSGHAWFDEVQFSGDARFDSAQFSHDAKFDEVQFSGNARFDSAQFFSSALFHRARFSGKAGFHGTHFFGNTWFVGAQFSGDADFSWAEFSADADFVGAQFSDNARFDRVQFSGDAGFEGARFAGEPGFHRVQFSGDARFVGAQFEAVSVLGPLACAARVDLSQSVFLLPVTVEAAAREVVCRRTRLESTATVHLRYAAVDLSHAVLSAPVAVIAHASPFVIGAGPVRDDLLTGPDTVRVTSVQGVDAAHLVLTDTDLTDCLFSGAFHLDQISLEGRITFAPTPTGWHRRGFRPVHWGRRRTLAEEHHWRAQAAGQPTPTPGHIPSPRLWRPGPHSPDPVLTPDPVDIAALYRRLRKAFEDGKNEPGAADFYYGECEMRRHDSTGTPTGERRLLWGYWLLSGYGLRASRAVGWLLAAMALTVLLLMGFGLPTHDPDPVTAGTVHGGKISLNTTAPDPILHGGWTKRITWARAEKATRVAVNSVVFRSSGQNLTTAGTYIEMTSRLLEPTLLALAALAVRGRIKR